MDYKRIFWGVILVILGAALMLKNLDIISFSWQSIFHLWPVLLILWGISVLPVKDIWKLLASLLIILLTVFFLWKFPQRFHNDWHFHWNDDEEEYTSLNALQSLDEPFDSLVTVGVINLDAAAGQFMIKDSSSRLIEFLNKGELGNYSMEVQKSGDTSIIDLTMHSRIEGDKDEDFKGGHRVNLKINPKPSWNLNMDVGAADLDLDLRNFKVDQVNLDGGASSVNILIGKLQKETHLDLETGASSIKITVPREAGCEVNYNTVLSQRDLKEFVKKGDGKYQTSNFNTSDQKVYLSIDAAVSSIHIIRE
jgi:hypothetical protein